MGHEVQTRGAIDLTDWIEIEDDEGDMTVVTFSEAVTVTSSRTASALK